MQADVYLGAALNGIGSNRGRRLSQDSIIDYDESSNSIFKNQLMVDAIFGARLHYFLEEGIGVTAGLQAQKSLTNWSNQADINYYPFSIGLQLGLSYRLD
jgi:hypothetical protein